MIWNRRKENYLRAAADRTLQIASFFCSGDRIYRTPRKIQDPLLLISLSSIFTLSLRMDNRLKRKYYTLFYSYDHKIVARSLDVLSRSLSMCFFIIFVNIFWLWCQLRLSYSIT